MEICPARVYDWDMSKIIRQRFTVSFDFPVVFTRQALSPDNQALAEAVGQGGPGPHRVGAVIDDGVAKAFPDISRRLALYAAAHAPLMELAGPPLVVPGGEQAKTGMLVAGEVLEMIHRLGLCRQSYVLAVGGGAVLDAVGFAAATAHRGLRLIRLPSTVLAQNDAGIGVKNAVNWFGRKNYLGTFAPPFAVINDFALLSGLPARHKRSGLAEAVKIALIRDREFFDRLYDLRLRLGALEQGPLEESIERCAELHLEHIALGGDPFELGSARPLDFGHWLAHALEENTGGELSHGEAVAIGVGADSVYTWLCGWLEAQDLERVLTTLAGMGFPLWHPAVAALDVAQAVESFREHLGGRLQLSLLNGLGHRREVDSLDLPRMKQALAWLENHQAARGAPAAQTGY
jgi:3-dehydroquinate synthase